MGILVFRDSEKGNRLVGRIDYEAESNATFCYDPDYLSAARASGEIGISERLPLSDEAFRSEEIAPFFRGLLPEGDVLTELTELYQIPRNDYFALIEQLGCESIGALTFVSEGIDPSEYVAEYLPLQTDAIESIATSPVRAAAGIASEMRLSLSGAQSKVAWFLPEYVNAAHASVGDWLVPKGTAPSTHIIKIARKGEERLAVNEMACSLISKACGIETAPISLVPDIPGAIAVERYDRPWIEFAGRGRVLRLHQEDLCQAVGLSPYFKYQPEGVDSSYLCMVADLLDEASSNPIADKLEFAKRTVFNYLVGNSDAHLKNSSLLFNMQWTGKALAPMYDVTCIPLSGYSTKMAFDIGAHRNLSDIDERDIMSIALDMGVPLGSFDGAVSELVSAFESFDGSNGEAGSDAATDTAVDRILENARPRVAVAKAFLG